MPDVVLAATAVKKEKTVKLKDAKQGEMIRFAEISFEEALNGDSGPLFYMVIPSKTKDSPRVTIVSIDGKVVLERDEDRPVVVHKGAFHIEPAELA